MSYDSEAKFEADLIKCLVEEKGWKDGVLPYKNEEDLIQIGQILFMKIIEILTVWEITK